MSITWDALWSALLAVSVLMSFHIWRNRRTQRILTEREKEQLLKQLYWTDMQLEMIGQRTGNHDYLEENRILLLRMAKKHGINYRIGNIPDHVRREFQIAMWAESRPQKDRICH